MELYYFFKLRLIWISYFSVLTQAIKNQKIIGVVSVVTLTELIKNLGEENRQKVTELTYTNLVFTIKRYRPAWVLPYARYTSSPLTSICPAKDCF